MKTKNNALILFLAVLVMFSALHQPVNAANEGLRYSSIKSAELYANANAAGLLSIDITYSGYNGITTGAKITTYVQKRTLGIFWTKVNNGQPNNEWVDNVSGSSNSISHSLQLSSSGTYRVTSAFTIYATSGNESFSLQRTITY